MVKIIVYTYKGLWKCDYSRRAVDNEVYKHLIRDNRIYAEDELGQYLNDGWSIISASTAVENETHLRLTVILKK